MCMCKYIYVCVYIYNYIYVCVYVCMCQTVGASQNPGIAMTVHQRYTTNPLHAFIAFHGSIESLQTSIKHEKYEGKNEQL